MTVLPRMFSDAIDDAWRMSAGVPSASQNTTSEPAGGSTVNPTSATFGRSEIDEDDLNVRPAEEADQDRNLLEDARDAGRATGWRGREGAVGQEWDEIEPAQTTVPSIPVAGTGLAGSASPGSGSPPGGAAVGLDPGSGDPDAPGSTEALAPGEPDGPGVTPGSGFSPPDGGSATMSGPMISGGVPPGGKTQAARMCVPPPSAFPKSSMIEAGHHSPS